ncbi:LicD family protein [Candidatus Pelagibacter ubique]|nr:LicD family protein [Candidatus Pelagibacter ubique]
MIKNISSNKNKVRVRTKNELEIRKYEFLIICNLLDELKIEYFLNTGILLGAIRNNGFIPWDWDAELSVYSENVINKFDNLVKKIIKSGFKIEKYYKEQSRLKIDFFGKLPSDVNAYTIQGWNHDKKKKIFWRNSFKIPDHFIINAKKIKLFNKYHFAPYPVEDYLEYKYGNWRKPIKTSNKYLYMRKEFSGMNISSHYIKKTGNLIKKFIFLFFKK